MAETAHINGTGADHSASDGQEEPFDVAKALRELDGNATFAHGHAETLKYLSEVATTAKGEELERLVNIAAFVSSELESYSGSAAVNLRELYHHFAFKARSPGGGNAGA